MRVHLFQGEQIVLVIDDVRVRSAAAQGFDARVVEGRIAVHREQDAARLVLCDVALRTHHAAAIVDAAVADAEHADVAFAVERNVSRQKRILRVGTDSIERAVQIRRDLAVDLAVTDVCLDARQHRLSTHRQRNLRAPTGSLMPASGGWDQRSMSSR